MELDSNSFRWFRTVVLVIAVVCILFVTQYNLDDGSEKGQRNLLGPEILLPVDQYMEYDGRLIHNTTTTQLPKLFKELLKKKIKDTNESGPLALDKVEDAVNQLFNDLGWDNNEQRFREGKEVIDPIRGASEFDSFLDTDMTGKSPDEHRRYDMVKGYSNNLADLENEERVATMFDIVVLTGNVSGDVYFLERWKHWIHDINVIIIQQGDPSRLIEIPSWVNYELYNANDMQKTVGKDLMYLFDIYSDNSAALNFGFLVADREYVFVLDKNYMPAFETLSASKKRKMNLTHTALNGESSSSSLGGGVAGGVNNRFHEYNIFHAHALNLNKASFPFYFDSPLHDPHRDDADFLRGYPYSMRRGLQTAISIGWVDDDDKDFDAPTIMAKMDSYKEASSRRNVHHPHHAQHPGHAHFSSFSKTDDVTVTVPHLQMYSLSFKNIAFSRKVVGPYICMVNAVANVVQNAGFGDRNYQLIAGWIQKALFDHVGLGVKEIVSPSYLMHHRNGVAPTHTGTAAGAAAHVNRDPLLENIQRDMIEDTKFMQVNEEVVRFFSSLKLPNHKYELNTAFPELLSRLRNNDLSPELKPIFDRIATMMSQYEALWSNINGFATVRYLHASRSSRAPLPTSPHQCAAFTIFHNESQMLPIWLRHYATHFPNATWALNHMRKDPEANKIKINETNLLGVDISHVKFLNLYGDEHGFPMGFFTSQAEFMLMRLLRWGYKCVLLSDVDELMLPDPKKYPGGLKQYIANYEKNGTELYYRMKGYLIAHIVDGEYVEKPIKWNEPIMQQRKYFVRQPKYDKCLLTKTGIRYKPGFHTKYLPLDEIKMDEDILLIHLKEFDHDFCFGREYQKFNLIRK